MNHNNKPILSSARKIYLKKTHQTNFFIIAALWFMLFSIKYDGVDIQKRN